MSIFVFFVLVFECFDAINWSIGCVEMKRSYSEKFACCVRAKTSLTSIQNIIRIRTPYLKEKTTAIELNTY